MALSQDEKDKLLDVREKTRAAFLACAAMDAFWTKVYNSVLQVGPDNVSSYTDLKAEFVAEFQQTEPPLQAAISDWSTANDAVKAL